MPKFEAPRAPAKNGITGQARQQVMISRPAWNYRCDSNFYGRFLSWILGKNSYTNRHSMVMASVAVAFGLVLGGCSAIPLHSEVRQKQGEDAKKTWGEVDLKATFTTERENLSKLLQAELQAQDRLALTVRNAELRKMLSNTNKQGLRQLMTARLVALIGSEKSALDALKNWTVIKIKLKSNAIAQREQRDRLATMGAPDVACTALPTDEALISNDWAVKEARLPVEKAGDAIPLLKELRRLCLEGTSFEAGLEASLVPLQARVGAALGELKTVRTEQTAARASRTMAEVAVKDNDNALKEALGSPDTKSSAERVAGASLKLKNALVALTQAQDAFSKQFVAKERLDKLEKALTDIATNSSTKPPEGSSKAVVAAILLPQIADDASAISAADRIPPTLPLIIMLDIERLRLEAATRQVKSLNEYSGPT